MSSRLNLLLLSKIRHNLKTFVNIICGFSELLLEELEDTWNETSETFSSKLRCVNSNGRELSTLIDQSFPQTSFSKKDFFLELSAQSKLLTKNSRGLIKSSLDELIACKTGSPVSFYNAYQDDFFRIEKAINGLKKNLQTLVKGIFKSSDSLVDAGVISQDDLNLVIQLSESLQETPDALKTDFPSSVLVVDDNVSNTEYLKRKLSASGHKVFSAESAFDAEALMHSSVGIDLILLDILMPGVSGYEFLRRNQGTLQTKNIPVIIVSSLDEQDTVYRCLEAGAQDFVTKPINFMILAARINAALERKHLLDKEEDYILSIEEEKEKNEKLLLNILPPVIAARMKENEHTIADTVENCTILFADIVGFTTMSQSLGAEKIVNTLNSIFSKFDEFCEEYDVEKIKTIGDAYMLASGVPNSDPNHAVKTVRMAMRMLSFVRKYPKVDSFKLSLRIGIHSGPVIAGVIGKKKFIYDLWGDTVNTAARMESHGIPDCIHMTEETASLLSGSFDLTKRPTLQVKGKGKMDTFLIGS